MQSSPSAADPLKIAVTDKDVDSGKPTGEGDPDTYYHDSFVDQIDSLLQKQRERAENLRKEYVRE